MENKFYITKFEGQMGNQILAYNNLCQLAYINKGKAFVPKDSEIYKYFKNVNELHDKIKAKNIDGWRIRGSKNLKYNNCILNPPNLGELFFYLNRIDPREHLILKDEYRMKDKMPEKGSHNVAIHVRKLCSCPYGIRPITDGKITCHCTTSKRKLIKNDASYDLEYIINAITHCLNKFKNPYFIIFAASNPDHFTRTIGAEKTRTASNFKMYDDLIEYLNNQKINYELSITQQEKTKSYVYDLAQMSECDVIISSPSTFCFSASNMGKKDKYIIYFEKFIKDLIRLGERGDIVWKELYEGGNQYYNVNKFI